MCILYVCTCVSWLVPQWLCTAVAFVSWVYISLCALNAAIYHVCIQVFDDKLVTQICTKGYMSPMCSTYTPFLLPPSLPSLSYTLQVYTFPLLHSGSLQHFPPLPSSPSHLPTLLYSSTIYCILCLGYIHSSFQVLTLCSVQPHQYIYELYSKVKRRWVRLSRAHSMGNLKELVHKATYCIQLCVQRVAERLNEAV